MAGTSPSTPARSGRIVIIGLGVVGAALADELTLRGARSVTVVDQGPLPEPGGSSSHAPGFVFQTNADRTMATLARRTLDKLDGLSQDGQWLLKRVGGLEVATTEARMRELHRRQTLAAAWGIPAEVVDPDEAGRLWPGLETSAILGALHTPTDGIVKSAAAVTWQARRAQENGATILGSTQVTAIEQTGGRVTGVRVQAVPGGEEDTIAADVVISCGGIWGPKIARELLGFELPMLPIEHCFGLSAPVPGLEGRHHERDEATRPLLRHQDFSLYLREYVDRIGIGAYRHRPIAVADDEIASPDAALENGQQPAIHDLTWEDFAPSWAEGTRLVPELGTTTFDYGFNGLFSFTPDGGPMLGPVPDVEGLWLAQAVWVTQSAGVAQVMADWILSDEPGVDTHGLEYTRFDPAVVTQDFTIGRGEQSYREVYDIIHPNQDTQILRELRTAPFYLRQQALGAVFGEANGWERPLWFESNQALLDELVASGDVALPERDDWSAQEWSPVAAAEAWATRNRAALYDMSALARVEVEGPGALEFLQPLVSVGIDKSVGSVTYAMMLDHTGGILSDVTVARLGADRFQIGTNGPLDLVYLKRQLAADSSVRVRDLTSGTCGLGLWGPAAREVLASITREDISNTALRFYRCASVTIAGVPALAMRLSYVGDLGYEIYTSADHGLRLWDRIMAAGQDHGIVPAGRRAFNSLRMEKGFLSHGADMTREHTPAEAGLDFALRGDHAFRGRAALEDRAVARRLVCLTLAEPIMGSEPVFSHGEIVGYVTSADQSYLLGHSIAYAWVPPYLAEAGTELEVGYFDQRFAATVVTAPIVDPQMALMRR